MQSFMSYLARMLGFGRQEADRFDARHSIDDSDPEGSDIRTSAEPTTEEVVRVSRDTRIPGADTDEDS
jgi:hypothetical protein